MKSKVFVLVLVLAMVFSSISKAQVSYGIRAGISLQDLNSKWPRGDDMDYDLKTGFHVGATAEMHITSDLYIQPGVLFSTKGAILENHFHAKEIKISISYIELPVNFLYKPAFGPGKLLMGIGPYLAVAIGGHVKRDDKEGKVKIKNEIAYMEWSDAPYDAKYYVKRFDFGGNLLFGYEFTKKITAQLNAQLGLANIAPKMDSGGGIDKTQAKNVGFGLSVGYRF
ncbi:PorT family protein [Niastella caeni]|uniref:PorT family protein n=1 Tax=Niastella caeni TaxID=2569763 RepID=A0A4S8HF25_9BACT|nr:porin family protein [Niastella caeni]THU33021.1 PorT family protein [Niastella caeni]